MTGNTKPNYYQTADGRDPISLMAEGLLTREQTTGFLEGNIIKYLKRWQHKNGLEDLQKAQEYLNRLISLQTDPNSVHEQEGTLR